MKLSRTGALTCFASLILIGCGSGSGSVKRDNLAYLYGKGSGSIMLSARVYHPSESRTEAHFKIPTRDLLYKGDGTGGPFRAVVRVAYETYADWNSRTVLDSANVLVQDKSVDPTENKELIGVLEIAHGGRSSFVLKVTATDLHRETQSTVMLGVDRSLTDPGQYFIPLDTLTGLPLFDDHLIEEQEIDVKSDVFAGRTLSGRWFAMDPALPVPVFASGSSSRSFESPDSVFTIPLDPTTGKGRFTPHKAGTYQMLTEPSASKGYSVHVLMDCYPFVMDATEMLKPMRYITSMQEFDRMSNSQNVRQAVERFWLDAAGERERARDAIRIYYGRVENANRHFTTNVEGWRTDRGLVHIIFGTPNTIYRGENNETWIYGEENNMMSLTFNFTRRSSDLSDNEMVLQRDPVLKGAWYRNVESWRNGRVYQN